MRETAGDKEGQPGDAFGEGNRFEKRHNSEKKLAVFFWFRQQGVKLGMRKSKLCWKEWIFE